jgi:hypothetical protein
MAATRDDIQTDFDGNGNVDVWVTYLKPTAPRGLPMWTINITEVDGDLVAVEAIKGDFSHIQLCNADDKSVEGVLKVAVEREPLNASSKIEKAAKYAANLARNEAIKQRVIAKLGLAEKD